MKRQQTLKLVDLHLDAWLDLLTSSAWINRTWLYYSCSTETGDISNIAVLDVCVRRRIGRAKDAIGCARDGLLLHPAVK